MLKFKKLQEEHLEQVMNWRVKPEVTEFMLTDVDYDLEAQLRWFKSISQNKAYGYWIIEYEKKPIGLFNLAAIDYESKKCSAGYYIGELDYRQLGAMIPPYFYNYVFNQMKFHKIYGEVVDGNNNVLKMHKIHGYRQVGVYKNHVFKGGSFYDVVLVELMSKTWLAQKRYRRFVAEWV